MGLGRVLAAITAIAALLGAVAAAAQARPRDPGATALEQAREESGVRNPPRSRHDVAAGVLRLSRSELVAGASLKLEVSFALDRDVAAGQLELTLPSRWVARSGVSDLPFARVPVNGRGAGTRARSRRDGRTLRFSFDDARRGDSARLAIEDLGIPAGRYRLRYSWREAGGGVSRGSAGVIFYAPVREERVDEVPDDWRALLHDVNATDDAGSESETFLSVVPGNRLRYVVGANGGGGYNAWITNTGGAPFTKAPLSASIDAPGEAAPEASDLCCDPISAADAAGNLWYGGLSDYTSAASPSRIVVARSAPASTAFVGTVGLRTRFATSGVQDKPMMTIDNSPSSPAYGRLYVLWDEPGAGVDIIMSQCDTRPGGVPNAANCDNADNWSVPVPVTPSEGSYIYADVATGPDGKVYVVWWDYSAANAIRGDVCNPATQNCASAAGWGTPQTIATLDATGGSPIPFACPILAQPGGRASTSPQVDVDRSGGPHNGRVYVTWSDLRTGSGTTKCASTPNLTHLTWDNFVASAAGALPGGASPSPAVATRLLTDGEGGGQANSDDWFAWLAVDQSTGLAWADFYSTRDVATRKTTHFYVRSVVPDGTGHVLGALRRVSTLPSDNSANTCCTFGNDYGDYTGIDATQGFALPVWSDRRSGLDGEAFVDVVAAPALVPDAHVVSDPAPGGDADGLLERGETFAVSQTLRNAGAAAASAVAGTLSAPAGSGLTVTQAASAYPAIAAGATAANTSLYRGTVAAGASCGVPITMTLRVTTASEPAVVPVPASVTCPPPPPPPPVAPPPPPPPPVAPPPPPPPAPPPPPPGPPPPPPPSILDTSVLFALTGRSPQKPPTSRRGIVLTLSCPLENCRVAMRATLTIPARRRGATARKVSLARSTVLVTRATRRTHTFKVSATLRRQVARALRSARTRRGVSVLVTATARDAAGNSSTKTKTIRVRT